MLAVPRFQRAALPAALWPILARFARFAVVGATGTAINLALFWLLSHRLGLHYLPAAALGMEAGLLNNYVLNNNWTFSDRRRGVISLAGLLRYHALSAGGMLINFAILWALTDGFGMRPTLANIAGIPPATAWNFALSLCWAWRGSA